MQRSVRIGGSIARVAANLEVVGQAGHGMERHELPEDTALVRTDDPAEVSDRQSLPDPDQRIEVRAERVDLDGTARRGRVAVPDGV